MKDVKILSIRSNETEHYLLLIASFGKIGLSQELAIELVQNLRNVIMDSQKDLLTRQEFGEARQQVKDEFVEVRQEIQKVRQELKAEIQEVRQEVSELRTELRAGLQGLRADFYQAINRLTFALIGSVIAIIGVLLANKFL